MPSSLPGFLKLGAHTWEGQLILILAAGDDLLDGKVKHLGELVVPGVMCWHSHDGAAAIAAQDIISHPDGNELLGGRIEGVAACRLTAASIAGSDACARVFSQAGTS